MNAVYLTGTLVADPEKVELGSHLVAEFTLAVEEYKDTSFFNCKAWDNWANHIKATKGARVVVEGRLVEERWIDKTTRENRSKVVVVASYVLEVAKTKAASGEPVKVTS